jgi:hypothetical protein
MRVAIDVKITPWKGRIENQYSRPARPEGKKIARCR